MSLLTQWKGFLADARGISIELSSCKFSPPAAVSDVEALEAYIEHRLPPKFRHFLLHECGGIDVWWHFRDDAEIRLDGEKESISSESFEFQTERIARENPQFHKGFIPDDYDSRYRPDSTLAFASTPNGDQFAVMLAGAGADSILYLSHDLEDIHRYVVGHDILTFLSNLARLGFVGPEFWILEQFTHGRTTPIDADSPNAKAFLHRLQHGIRSTEAEAQSKHAAEIARLVRFRHIIEPEARRLVEAKSPKRFLALVEDYVDLLPDSLKARYDYYRKEKKG